MHTLTKIYIGKYNQFFFQIIYICHRYKTQHKSHIWVDLQKFDFTIKRPLFSGRCRWPVFFLNFFILNIWTKRDEVLRRRKLQVEHTHLFTFDFIIYIYTIFCYTTRIYVYMHLNTFDVEYKEILRSKK